MRSKGCVRLISALIKGVLFVIIVVVLAFAGFIGEGEVRAKQALDLLSLTVQGPDEGNRKQRSEGSNLTVALAQMSPVPLDMEANLAKVEGFLGKAREQGATLLVLPELALTGLDLSNGIWEAAEPLRGPSVQALQALTAEYGIDVATSIVERADGHVYNTAVLVSSEGSVVSGRKLHPPMAERARFALGEGPQVVGTAHGRIAMVLCADAFRAETFTNLLEADPDLVLMMASAPLPDLELPGFRFYTPQEWSALAAYYSDRLGVPVVSAHACGPTHLQLPWTTGFSVPCHYAGATRIVSRRTRVSVSPPEGEEMLTATEIFIGRLGPSLEAPFHGDYLVPRPLIFNAFTAWSESRAATYYEANIGS